GVTAMSTVVVMVSGALLPLVMLELGNARTKPALPLATFTVTGPAWVVAVPWVGITSGKVSPGLTVTPLPPTTLICVATGVPTTERILSARVIVLSAQLG